MADNVTLANTPKGIGADGFADVPSAYIVTRFECVNQDGAKFDINPLVTSFTITEELFSPIIVLNLKIRDTVNFFEDFSLNGQEKIFLELERENKQEKTRSSIKLSFAVKEYPNYQKTASEPNVQEYNIIAVSEFSYASMLQRISRSVKGNPLDGIKKIFTEDLNTPFEAKSICVSSFDGIITIQSPLKAVEWLRTKAFDSNGGPFFIFSNIASDKVMAQGLSDIWSKNNKFWRSYEYRQFIVNPVNSPEFYAENAIRILDMRSNIKLDKLAQATGGGFASKTNITDLTGKTFTQAVFDYTKDSAMTSTKMDAKSAFSLTKSLSIGAGSIGKKSLNELSDASISNLSTNSGANYQGNPNSSSGPIEQNLSRAKSFYANLEAVSHQVQVYGDFNLNPGKKIRITIPKSIDMGSYNGKNKDDQIDRSLSGDYIVSVVAHTFVGGIYTAKLKIIKDA